MPAELIQSLAIFQMELIEKGTAVWVGQRSKNIIHREAESCNQMVAYPFSPRKPLLLLLQPPGPD